MEWSEAEWDQSSASAYDAFKAAALLGHRDALAGVGAHFMYEVHDRAAAVIVSPLAVGIGRTRKRVAID